jgi:hypothetical protein
MRPIDADSLKKEAMTFNLGNEDYPCMEKLIYESDIDESPTLDVAPVIYAHWEEGSGEWVEMLRDWYMRPTYICSNCRKEEKKKTPYCPNCGAIMDLE